jgi:hypothetical protein
MAVRGSGFEHGVSTTASPEEAPMFSPHWHHVLHLLPWRKPVRCRANPPHDDAMPPQEDRPLGCGWFDSSHDLQQGLQVGEADGQALALLPLADWLALQLTPCCDVDTSMDTGAGMIAEPTLH